jgi:hypothetical protein
MVLQGGPTVAAWVGPGLQHVPRQQLLGPPCNTTSENVLQAGANSLGWSLTGGQGLAAAQWAQGTRARVASACPAACPRHRGCSVIYRSEGVGVSCWHGWVVGLLGRPGGAASGVGACWRSAQRPAVHCRLRARAARAAPVGTAAAARKACARHDSPHGPVRERANQRAHERHRHRRAPQQRPRKRKRPGRAGPPAAAARSGCRT